MRSRGLSHGAVLQGVEVGVDAVRPAHQFGVAADFVDLSSLHDDNPVGSSDGREPVSNDQHRASTTDASHVVLDDLLGLVVERAGRFVEDEDARIADEGARDCNALTLPPG